MIATRRSGGPLASRELANAPELAQALEARGLATEVTVLAAQLTLLLACAC